MLAVLHRLPDCQPVSSRPRQQIKRPAFCMDAMTQIHWNSLSCLLMHDTHQTARHDAAKLREHRISCCSTHVAHMLSISPLSHLGEVCLSACCNTLAATDATHCSKSVDGRRAALQAEFKLRDQRRSGILFSREKNLLTTSYSR